MIDFLCPRCRGPLEWPGDAYRCMPCGARYPIVLGIPDFRVEPDPYLSIEDDWAKGRRLEDRAPDTDFAGLVRYYWSLTPGEPEEQASRFLEYALAGRARGQEFLDSLDREGAAPRRTGEAAAGPGMARALEIGCRTGGVLQAIAERIPQAVGIDVSFRWLVVARKGLAERGLSAELVCCNAEHLPFPDRTFDLTIAENVLEHARSPAAILQEGRRTLRPGGRLLAITWNRLALAPEPHVRLWGVGWLPRSVARWYVRARRGSDYSHVRLLSVFGLRAAARSAGFGSWRVDLPDFGESMVSRLSPAQALLIRWYEQLKRVPLFRPVFLMVAPVLHLDGRRDD